MADLKRYYLMGGRFSDISAVSNGGGINLDLPEVSDAESSADSRTL